MYTHIILRYGEIFLKGKNQYTFLRSLKTNTEKIASQKNINIIPVRLLMAYFENHQLLKNVFGLTSYSPALRIEKEPSTIMEAATKFLQNERGTFKIETKRSDKRLPHTYIEFNKIIGEKIEERTTLRFSFSEPDIILHIEINDAGAYLFTKTIPCHGGLPTGVEGCVGLIIKDKMSILAGLLFMKRGCDIYPLIINPTISLTLLQQYSPKELYHNIIQNVSEIDFFVQEQHLHAIVDGATLETLTPPLSNTVVFHPLIHYTNKEVERELNKYKE